MLAKCVRNTELCNKALRTANDVINLNQTIINQKTEIEKLEQMKKKYSFQLLPPLQPLPRYPSWNSYYY